MTKPSAIPKTPFAIISGSAEWGLAFPEELREPAVKVVGTFPENSHPRILYPVALPASAEPEARKFVEFLLSGRSRSCL